MRRLPPAASRASSRAVDVVHTAIPDVDGPALSALLARLPAGEQERAARFRHDGDRARFAFGRLLLRELVSRVLGGGGFRVEVESSGRPIIVGTPYPLFVSLSHSGRHVAAAAGRRPVGIDVEQLPREEHSDGVVRRVCSPGEQRSLQRLDPAERGRAFMRIWTRKEAYGKAVGVGLGFELTTVTVGLRRSSVRGVRGRWRVVDLDLGASCAAALAVAGGRPRVNLDGLDSASL